MEKEKRKGEKIWEKKTKENSEKKKKKKRGGGGGKGGKLEGKGKHNQLFLTWIKFQGVQAPSQG